MNLFDLAAIVAVSVLVVYGAVKGIVRLALWVASMVFGWILAVRFCEPVAALIWGPPDPQSGPSVAPLGAFAIIFLTVAIAAALLAWLTTRMLSAIQLRWVDRQAGAGVGLLLGIALVCAATIPLVAFLPVGAGLLRDSALAPYAVAGGDYLKALTPESIRKRFTDASRTFFQD